MVRGVGPQRKPRQKCALALHCQGVQKAPGGICAAGTSSTLGMWIYWGKFHFCRYLGPAKKLLISTKVLGLAAFGWFFRTTTMAKTNKLQTMISKTLQESHCASPELRHILRGHNLHVRFWILHGMLGTIHRRAQKQMLTDKQWHTPWAANLQRLMK